MRGALYVIAAIPPKLYIYLRATNPATVARRYIYSEAGYELY